METGKAKLNGEVNVNFSRQVTSRKNGKIVKNDKTIFNFSFKVLIAAAVVFSAVLITYFINNYRQKGEAITSESAATSAKNVVLDSSTHNNVGQITTDNSVNYIYPHNSSITIDKSVNKFNSNSNNVQQLEINKSAEPLGKTAPKNEQLPANSTQIHKELGNQAALSSYPTSKAVPPLQNPPINQISAVDFKLMDYLAKMKNLALTGRKIADGEQSLDTCVFRQNAWYQKTLPFLKEFQSYLQTNYSNDYFLVSDSMISKIETEEGMNSESCKQRFDAQGSILISLSQRIRIELRKSLPNSEL